jgi:F-type H+-transporting ATPase subunit b
MQRILPAVVLFLMPVVAFAGGDGEKGGLLDVNPGLIVWTVVTFLITLVVLRLVAWKPILEAVEAREKGIQDAIDSAKRDREEAERLMAENKRVLDEARRHTADIVSQGQKDAERIVEEAKAGARQEAEKVLEQSRKQIEQETRAAMAEVRGTVADLALQAAGRLLGETIDEQRQRGLVEDYVKELEGKSSTDRPS